MRGSSLPPTPKVHSTVAQNYIACTKRSEVRAATVICIYNRLRLNGKVTSGLEGRVPQFLSQFQKPFVLDSFQAISVNFLPGRHMKIKGEIMRCLETCR